MTANPPPPDFLEHHATLLLDSFQSALGRPLLPGTDAAQRLYAAPFVVLSHNTQADPILTYANLAAQRLWEMGWAEMTAMPSRLTAEPDERAARAALFDALKGQGYLDSYEGIRISATGQRFRISEAIIWTVTDPNGCHLGEAATFSEIEFL